MPTGSRARRDSPGRLLPELRRAELEGVLGASLVDTMRAHGALAPRARIDPNSLMPRSGYWQTYADAARVSSGVGSRGSSLCPAPHSPRSSRRRPAD